VSEVHRFQWDPIGMRDCERAGYYRQSTFVDAADFDAKAAECEALKVERVHLREVLHKAASTILAEWGSTHPVYHLCVLTLSLPTGAVQGASDRQSEVKP